MMLRDDAVAETGSMLVPASSLHTDNADWTCLVSEMMTQAQDMRDRITNSTYGTYCYRT